MLLRESSTGKLGAVILYPARKFLSSQKPRSLFCLFGTLVLTSCATATAVDQGPEVDATVAAIDATIIPNQPDARTIPTPDAGAPDSAIPVDAAVAPDATGCMATQSVNLLINSNFDGAAGSWIGSPSEVSIVRTPPVAADSSPNVAWLGGATSSRDILHQDIAVPIGATTLVLSGRIRQTTDEFLLGNDDVLRLDITDTSDAVLAVLDNWGEGVDSGWVDFSYPLADYAGQTIRIRLDADNDSSLISNFFIDSMQLSAMTCP